MSEGTELYRLALKKARSNGVTTAELAKRVGKARATLFRAGVDPTQIGLSTCSQIADAAGLTRQEKARLLRVFLRERLLRTPSPLTGAVRRLVASVDSLPEPNRWWSRAVADVIAMEERR